MAQYTASQYQWKWSALNPDLTCGNPGIVAQSTAMFQYNSASSRVTCRGFIQQEWSYTTHAPELVLWSCSKEMQYLFHAFKLEKLQEALLESRWRIDA